jgi:cytochrome c-type biogenesis protein CcmH/NrfF
MNWRQHLAGIEHFAPEWNHLASHKCGQIKEIERRSGSIRTHAALAFAAALTVAGAAFAVQPDEMLSDPALEARARAISAGLRCLVCQNQSIDDSDADLARDLRILVRDRLKAGDTDRQVVDYIVSRYGEFVLLKPRLSARNALLWATPLVLLIGGGVVIFLGGRKGRKTGMPSLSAEEDAALRKILEGQD